MEQSPWVFEQFRRLKTGSVNPSHYLIIWWTAPLQLKLHVHMPHNLITLMLNPCPVKSVVVTSRQNVLKRGSVVLEDCLCTIKLEKNTADQIWNKILLLQSLTMLHLSLQMFSIRLVFSCTLKMFLWKVFMSRRLLWVLFHCEARVVEALALGKYLFKVELSLLMQCWIVWWKIAHHVFYFNTACFERALAPYKSAPNGEPYNEKIWQTEAQADQLCRFWFQFA